MVTTLLTVTAQVAVTPLPSLAVAVMLAVPKATAVTLPSASTVATASLSLLQVTVWSVASSGVTLLTLSVSVWPAEMVVAVLLSVMAVTRVAALPYVACPPASVSPVVQSCTVTLATSILFLPTTRLKV